MWMKGIPAPRGDGLNWIFFGSMGTNGPVVHNPWTNTPRKNACLTTMDHAFDHTRFRLSVPDLTANLHHMWRVKKRTLKFHFGRESGVAHFFWVGHHWIVIFLDGKATELRRDASCVCILATNSGGDPIISFCLDALWGRVHLIPSSWFSSSQFSQIFTNFVCCQKMIVFSAGANAI